MPAAHLRTGEQIQGGPHPRRAALPSFPMSNSPSELAQALVKRATSSCCADVGAHCSGWQMFLKGADRKCRKSHSHGVCAGITQLC